MSQLQELVREMLDEAEHLVNMDSCHRWGEEENQRARRFIAGPLEALCHELRHNADICIVRDDEWLQLNDALPKLEKQLRECRQTVDQLRRQQREKRS